MVFFPLVPNSEGFAVNKTNWSGRSTGSTLGNRIFMEIIRRVGPWPAYALLLFVSSFYAATKPNLRAIIREFRRHLGLETAPIHYALHFFSFGMNLIDGLAFLKRGPTRYRFTCIGEDKLSEALSRKKGLILLSAHVGNWEIAGNLLFDHLNTRVNLVMFDNERVAIKRVHEDAMSNRRINIISLSQDSLQVMIQVKQALRDNEIVCFLGDRILDGQPNEQVTFFNDTAKFPRGPFAVAAATEAPIVPVFTLRKGPLHYVHRAEEIVSLEGVSRAERPEKLRRAVERYVGVLEETVRRHPYQWYNFFHFWGT